MNTFRDAFTQYYSTDDIYQNLNKIKSGLGDKMKKTGTLNPSVLQMDKVGFTAKDKKVWITINSIFRQKLEAITVKPKITSSRDAYEVLYPVLKEQTEEQFWALMLNRANMVISKELISIGGITGTTVDQRVLFHKALEFKATGMILAHNHPSGNLKPSEADKEFTKKIAEGGKLLDITVFDHIIFTDNGYFSFLDEGLLKH